MKLKMFGTEQTLSTIATVPAGLLKKILARKEPWLSTKPS